MLPPSAGRHMRHSLCAIAAMTVVIALSSQPSAQRRGRNDNSSVGAPVATNTVVDNPDGFISPGMFGQLRLFAGKPFDTLLVPDQSIVTDQTRQVVYVVDAQGVIGQKVVHPGRLMDGLRVIREGLEPHDRIVISGVQRARPGRKVTVKTAVGELLVEWRADGTVMQTGEACAVYRGEWLG